MNVQYLNESILESILLCVREAVDEEDIIEIQESLVEKSCGEKRSKMRIFGEPRKWESDVRRHILSLRNSRHLNVPLILHTPISSRQD